MKRSILLGLTTMLLVACDGTHQEPQPEKIPIEVQDPKGTPPRLGPLPEIGTGRWAGFRGNAALDGHASGTLGQRLVPLWHSKVGTQLDSSPVVADGRLFIGSDDGQLYALDAATGKTLWRYPTQDAVLAPPLVHDGVVYVGSTDTRLYAVQATDGKLKWSYKTSGEIKAAAGWSLAEDGKTPLILVGSYDNKLHCVDARSGQRVWTYKADNYINGAPALAAGKVVFGGCDSYIHVVSLTGRKLARIDSGSYIGASAAAAGGRVYIGNHHGQFLCADLTRYTVLWRHKPGRKKPVLSSAAVSSEAVVFGRRDGSVTCLDLSGKLRWQFKAGDYVDSSPVICGDKVVVGSDDGRLYLLSLIDGKKLWSKDLGEAIATSPAVTAGRVFVACADGAVYAFGSAK